MLDNGVRPQVEKYEFISPDDERVHECCTARCRARRAVAGACPWAGRLSPTTRAQRN